MRRITRQRTGWPISRFIIWTFSGNAIPKFSPAVRTAYRAEKILGMARSRRPLKIERQMMLKHKPKTRSPLKDKPLHYPGQSLDAEIDRVLSDEVITWIMMVVLVVLYTLLEWLRWAASGRFHPIIFSIAACFVVLIAVWKIRHATKKMKALRLGRDGERAVGQYLEALRETGCRVFHDLTADNFNVDHVIVSPHGIFTVETKTFSKPVGKPATVRVQNGAIVINGNRLSRDLLAQGAAQAKWVKAVLRESTGKDYPVKPVIVFPGWYVEPVSREERLDAWVLNPKALPVFIENEPVALEPHDVMLAAYHLSRYIRTAG